MSHFVKMRICRTSILDTETIEYNTETEGSMKALVRELTNFGHSEIEAGRAVHFEIEYK